MSIDKDGLTVLDLKKACTEKACTTIDDIRLIYKGQILKDKNTLIEYKIADIDTVYLIKSNPAGSKPKIVQLKD